VLNHDLARNDQILKTTKIAENDSDIQMKQILI